MQRCCPCFVLNKLRKHFYVQGMFQSLMMENKIYGGDIWGFGNQIIRAQKPSVKLIF